MKKEESELVQFIQEIFANNENLTIVITDSNGNMITTPSNNNLLTDIILKRRDSYFVEQFSNIFHFIYNLEQPTVYTINPGFRIIIAPIILENSRYYIWAGLLVEEQNNSNIREYLSKYLKIDNNEKYWIIINTNKDEQYFTSQIAKLVKVLHELIEHKQINRSKNNIKEFLMYITNLDAWGQHELQTVLSKFKELVDTIEFTGLAIKQLDGNFKITHLVGKNEGNLKNSVFTPGEGFLGQCIVTAHDGIWTNIENDPRNYYFKQKGIIPRHLFCFPVLVNEKVEILFFGGTSKKEVDEDNFHLAKFVTELISTKYKGLKLQEEFQEQKNILNALMEIIHAFTHIIEYEKVSYFLVDMSLNLAQGEFSCVILKDDSVIPFQIISRRMTDNQIERYSQSVKIRYFDNSKFDSNKVSSHIPTLYQTEESKLIAEIPLSFEGRLIGLHSIAIEYKQEYEKYKMLFSTLGILGSFALQRYLLSEQNKIGQHIEVLHQSLRYWQEDLYNYSNRGLELTQLFINQLNLTEQQKIMTLQAARIVPLELSFIEDVIGQNYIYNIIKEYNQIILSFNDDEKLFFGLESQILALVYTYIDSEDEDKLYKLKGINKSLFTTFVSVLYKYDFIEDVIHDVIKEVATTDVNFLTIQKLYSLSSREVEVLKQVFAGLNNQEIAEKLYISPHTVKNHLSKIFTKLEVHDRSQAMAKVYKIYSKT